MLMGIRQRSSLILGLGGVGLGYAVLTRGFLLPAIFLLPATLYFTRKVSRALCLWLLITALILPALWIWRNHRETGRWQFSSEAQWVLWEGNNRWARGSWPGDIVRPDSEQRRYLLEKYPEFLDVKEMKQADILLNEAVIEFRSNPGHVLSLLPRKAFILFLPVSYMGFDVAYSITIPFVVIGLILLLSNNEQRLLGTLIGVLVGTVVITCTLTFGDPRFRATVDPLLFLASGYAGGYLAHRRGKHEGGAGDVRSDALVKAPTLPNRSHQNA
jgi:hypothetical protein